MDEGVTGFPLFLYQESFKWEIKELYSEIYHYFNSF